MNINDLTMSIADTLCDAQERCRTYQDLLNTAEVVVVLMRDHGSLKVSRDTVRHRIVAPLTERRHGLRWWLQFAKKLVKLIGPQRPQRTLKQPKQRDPAALRAELIDSVADDLNSAQVQSMVEGKADKQRLDSVAGVASQRMGGDSFIPILRRLEGPLLTDEQWKEFLWRIPYR